MRRGSDRGFVEIGALYKSDFDKQVVLRTLERRGWQRTKGDDDEDWDLYWASVHTVRAIFNPENGRRLHEHQLVNHYPNHYELTRKDLMHRNIKRYRKEKEKHLEAAIHGDDRQPFSWPDEHELPQEWVPTTFALPSDYALFVEEFRRNPNVTWIAKPTGKAQGRGIFLVSKLNQLKKWAGGQAPSGQTLFREPYVVSRYIADPLLVGGKKFDMRMYVLVTNYRPLKAFLYRGGFCRFCVEQYSSDVAELDNVFVHLTNVAIQKNAEDYNDKTGGKWAYDDLLLFIESTRGIEARDKLVIEIEAVLAHSLKAVQSAIINDKHCFEMYGFDILLDSSLKPWLLEVNASPSLSTTTEDDRLLKMRLINDVIGLVYACRAASAPAAAASTGGGGGIGSGGGGGGDGDGELPASALGGFAVLVDEGSLRQRREEEMMRRSSNGLGFRTYTRRRTGGNWR